MITAFFTQVLPLGWAVPHFTHNNTLDGVCLVSVLSGFLCLLWPASFVLFACLDFGLNP